MPAELGLVNGESLAAGIRCVDKNRGNVVYSIQMEGTGLAITQNEWFKVQRFKEAHDRYAVMNAATSPHSYLVKSPAETWRRKRAEVVRYVVQSEEIRTNGAKTA